MTKARDLANAADVLDDVSATELSYVNGVTSSIQTQLNNISGSKAQPTEPSSPTDGMIWVDTDGSTTDANFIPKTLTSTTGDIIYASSANTPARLGIGSTSQVLTVSGGVPTWATPAGGKVLQVVNATYDTSTTNSTSTFADTGLTASITPSSATSKVLVFVNQSGCRKGDQDNGNSVVLNLLRGATQIVADFAGRGGFTNSLVDNYFGSASVTYLDSPATTSSTTYKTQFKNYVNGANVTVQAASGVSSITLLEIGA